MKRSLRKKLMEQMEQEYNNRFEWYYQLKREMQANKPMKQFNINDCIYIQITNEGWLYLLQTAGLAYINNCIKPNKVQINNEEWYRLQLWSVFDLLPINFGGQPLFKPTILIDELNNN